MSKPTAMQNEAHGLRSSHSSDAFAPLAVAATFTAEPLQEVLQFWFDQLALEISITCADYNQIFQQLLNPLSLLSQNQGGINLLLLRLEDWVRFQSGDTQTLDALNTTIENNSRELIKAVIDATQRTSTDYIITFCPSKPGLPTEQQELYQHWEQTIATALDTIKSVYLIRSQEIFSRYPITGDVYDPSRDRIGHIPFTPEAFSALGTTIARTVYGLKQNPYKVIALDCDRTLWRGICGEDGPLGISVDSPFQALQSFMVRCSEAGFLLCLCSKNVEDDVWQVFDQRDDMPLTRQHLVGWRINWQPKSENLRSLAKELNLGLDSFIFIDDNPVECSEVQARCPEVLTLQLPADASEIPAFLNHVWPLDTLKVTEADKNRTQLYQQNTARKQFEQEATDFNAFIQGLQLEVQITPPTPEQLPRVSQLTQRTNQFNATTRRRSESEIQQLCDESGYGCRAVTVKDRFGDYGLVGVMLFQQRTETLNVDTFLLSCRVLGRGVEHRMIAHLGALAADQGLTTVTLNYHPTPKNLPVANFFKTIGQPYHQATSEGCQYDIPTAVAQALSFSEIAPTAHEQTEQKPSPSTPKHSPSSQQSPATSKSDRWHHVLRELHQPSQILARISTQNQQQRDNTTEYIAPRTITEQKLHEIWCQVLQLNQISITDNLFDLGNTSLKSVNAFTAIEATLGKRLPMTTLLEAPTIETLAPLIDHDPANHTWSPLVTGRSTGSKPPLYIVHGGYGDVLSTAQIIDFLDDDQPVYLLRAMGLDGQQQPLDSIEAMAAAYIQTIQNNQPEGPYQLAGQCSGGVVAFEMAQQLTRQGHVVSFVGLLDTPHPQLENHFTNRLRYYFHRPTYRHARWDASYSLFTAIYYLRRLGISFNYHRNKLSQQTSTTQLQYLANKLEQISSRFTRNKLNKSRPQQQQDSQSQPTSTPKSPSITLPSNNSDLLNKQQFIKDQFVEVFLRAQKDYIPQPYGGKIDFFLAIQQSFVPQISINPLDSFKARTGPIQNATKLKFGWDQLVAPGDFKVHHVDCPHPLMFDQPYVQRLGKTLQHIINSISTDVDLVNK